MAKEIASAASKCKCPHIPPEASGATTAEAGSVPQAATQSLTIQDLKELLEELIKAKSAGSARVSDAPQPVEPAASGDSKTEEDPDEKFHSYKTVNEV